MNVLGIDYSSKLSGHTLVENGSYREHAVWKPTSTEQKIGGLVRLGSYYTWLNTWVGLRKSLIDLAVVEELVFVQSVKTALVLGNFETVALIVPFKHGIPVVRVKAGQARNLVLGMNPNSKKEEVLIELRRRYPEIKWPPKNAGGEDVADAFVMAKAGPLAIGR